MGAAAKAFVATPSTTASPQAHWQGVPSSSYSSLAHAVDPAYARRVAPAVVGDEAGEHEVAQNGAEGVDTSAQARGLNDWEEFKRRLSESVIRGGGDTQGGEAMEEGNAGQEAWQGEFR